MDRLDDVATQAKITQAAFGIEVNHPLSWTCGRCEAHAFEPLQPADGEPASFGIVGAWIIWPQVDEARFICRHPDRNIETGPALRFHLPLQGRTDFMLWLGAEFSRDQVLGAGPQAVADVITGDDEIGAILRDAPHQQMDVRVVGVPMIDRDPLEPGPEITLHLGDEVAGEGFEIGHLGGIFRRDDEAEVMPIVMAAPYEGRSVRPVLRGAEHMRLLTIAADAVAPQVGDVGGERRRTEGTGPMPDDAGLHDDAAMTRKEPAGAERGASSPECRTAVPSSTGRIRAAIAGFFSRAQHLIDEALAAAVIADASQSDVEIFITAVHRCNPACSFLGQVLERDFEKPHPFPASGTRADRRTRREPTHVNGLAPCGG